MASDTSHRFVIVLYYSLNILISALVDYEFEADFRMLALFYILLV